MSRAWVIFESVVRQPDGLIEVDVLISGKPYHFTLSDEWVLNRAERMARHGYFGKVINILREGAINDNGREG